VRTCRSEGSPCCFLLDPRAGRCLDGDFARCGATQPRVRARCNQKPALKTRSQPVTRHQPAVFHQERPSVSRCVCCHPLRVGQRPTAPNWRGGVPFKRGLAKQGLARRQTGRMSAWCVAIARLIAGPSTPDPSRSGEYRRTRGTLVFLFSCPTLADLLVWRKPAAVTRHPRVRSYLQEIAGVAVAPAMTPSGAPLLHGS
jgi:hypothetical protein